MILEKVEALDLVIMSEILNFTYIMHVEVDGEEVYTIKDGHIIQRDCEESNLTKNLGEKLAIAKVIEESRSITLHTLKGK